MARLGLVHRTRRRDVVLRLCTYMSSDICWWCSDAGAADGLLVLVCRWYRSAFSCITGILLASVYIHTDRYEVPLKTQVNNVYQAWGGADKEDPKQHSLYYYCKYTFSRLLLTTKEYIICSVPGTIYIEYSWGRQERLRLHHAKITCEYAMQGLNTCMPRVLWQ